ncbi:porin [Burkholderia sp. OK233]|nr:porin [Burkholderia sp. OK233]
MKKTKTKRFSIAGCTVALMAPGFAGAQSSVTLQGVIDAGVTYVNNQHGGAATLFDSGVLSPDLLTFKGSEDLVLLCHINARAIYCHRGRVPSLHEP